MDQKTHFFRLLLPGFLTKFGIPKSFILKQPHLIDSSDCGNYTAVLKDKRGIGNLDDKTWPVRVDSDGSRFLDGWREFADDHSLRVGDFLVFDHLGGFVFDVLLFDSASACARSFLSMDKPGEAVSRRGNSHPTAEDLNAVSVCARCLSRDKTTLDSESRGEESTPNEDFVSACPQRESTEDGESRLGNSIPDEGINPIPASCAPSLSTEENVDVENRGEPSTPKDIFKPSSHPYFRASVKKYCFEWHAMLIPTQFARINNLAKRWCEMILIDQNGRRWPVNLRHRKTGKDQTYMASGWDDFAAANKLKIGDSMVYELLISGSEPVMKFYKVS